MQRSRPIFVLGRRIGAVVYEEPREIQMTPKGRLIQGSPPIFVLGCRIGAVLDEEPREIQMTT